MESARFKYLLQNQSRKQSLVKLEEKEAKCFEIRKTLSTEKVVTKKNTLARPEF